MPESLATTFSLTATLATPTMTPLATPTPTPTLQPADAYVVYISVLVPVAVLLCVCIVCCIVCCCCCCWCWWITSPGRNMPDPSFPEYHIDNPGFPEYHIDIPCPTLAQSPMSSDENNDPGFPEYYIDNPGFPEYHIDNLGFPEYATDNPCPQGSDIDKLGIHYSYSSLERWIWEPITADERKLYRLCLIGFNINELTIHQRGGTFPLGNGDATLIVDEGTVEMETVVRYAVILHGPFVYSAGYKPASVVVYLNLEGANLLKPLKLMLKHWCKPVEGNSDGEAVLKLLRAPHTTSEMENFRYIFNEVQGNFLRNTATFTISEPQCLYCVEMKKESEANYNAIAFQKNLSENNLVKFRIQFMCDCLEWSAYMTMILEQQGWKINNQGDGGVPKFSFHDRQITATPHELHGPGWQAAIDGHQSVRERDFLEILGREKNEVIAEVRNGRYPPCIYYQMLYTSVAERRRVPTFWRTELQGADVKLFFSCKVLQELELSLPPAEPIVTAVVVKAEEEKIICPSKYGSLQLKDLVRYAVPRVSPKWEEVGLQLDIAPHFLETVEADHRDVEKRCKAMFKKWLHSGEGTGKQPRIWESVLEAVRKAVGSEVCMNIEEDIVQDIEGPSDPPAKKAKGLKHATSSS